MINSRVPSDIVVGKGSLLMGCDIVVREGGGGGGGTAD